MSAISGGLSRRKPLLSVDPLASGGFILRLRLALVVAHHALIRTVRRLGLKFRHALLTAVLATLILHTFQIVLFGHLRRLCVALSKVVYPTQSPAAMFLPAICQLAKCASFPAEPFCQIVVCQDEINPAPRCSH
jgi:hypothetical protein